MRLEHAIKNVVNNQLEEGTALQIKMALSDVGIRNPTWKNNKVYVKKRDVKKAEKALKGNVIYKGKTPVVVGEDVDEAKKPFKSFAHTLKDLVNNVPDEQNISEGQNMIGNGKFDEEDIDIYYDKMPKPLEQFCMKQQEKTGEDIVDAICLALSHPTNGFKPNKDVDLQKLIKASKKFGLKKTKIEDKMFKEVLQHILKVEKSKANIVEAKISHTPGQDNMGEHPISKNTADYEEKYFTLPGGEGKDDREKMGVTGKPKEHKKDVESTENHENPTKKTRKPPTHVAEDLESLNQQRVQELLEKYGPKQG